MRRLLVDVDAGDLVVDVLPPSNEAAALEIFLDGVAPVRSTVGAEGDRGVVEEFARGRITLLGSIIPIGSPETG